MRDDPKFSLKDLKDDDLCEELKALKPDEREGYLKKKAAERADIQKRINDLSAERAKIVAEERKKQPKTDGEKALDEALRGIIREQARAAGFEVN
jgi:tRNA uridine 5-carbamoylmethylation protein Kti12